VQARVLSLSKASARLVSKSLVQVQVWCWALGENIRGLWLIFCKACLPTMFFSITVRGETARGGLIGLMELEDGAVREYGL
jgi:hypothetical protein